MAMEWSTEQAFNKVKLLFSNELYIFHPTKTGSYVLNYDASDYAIGGLLYQYDENGKNRVIAHA